MRLRAPFLILGCWLVLAAIPSNRAADYDTSQMDEQTLKNAGLPTDGPALLDYLRKRTLTEYDREKLATLVRQLGDSLVEVRDRATADLISLGSVAIPMLRQAAKDPDEQDVSSRAIRILSLLEGNSGPTLSGAVVRLVALRAPADAAEVLLTYLPFADDHSVVEEVKSALAAVGVRDGKPDKALVLALEDKVPIRRAVAAEALCQARGGEAIPAVLKLLEDVKPAVRLRAAIALGGFREGKAVSTMIDLLTELPGPQARQAEEFLISLAADQAPKVPLGTDDAQRKKCQEAWSIWWKATEGAGPLDEFRKRTLDDAKRAEMVALIKNLGHDAFDIREKASNDLVTGFGTAAVPLLRQALTDPDLEVRDRAQKCLQRIEKEKPTALSLAAPRVVALRKPAGATEALIAYLPFADDEAIVSEVQTALLAVGIREGKADPALVKALEDKVPARRIAAVEVLCQGALTDHRQAVRKLLDDEDNTVRLKAALALANARDRDAIPTLITLLGVLPPEQASFAEDYLRLVAGDKAPNVSLGMDKAAREKCRDAWAAWWKDNGARIDLAKIDTSKTRLLGYTLLVMPDTGQVVELGPDNKPRWTLHGLNYPFDAQVLPGDRVLIAEYNGMRVTERDLKGNIVWEKRGLNNPVSCRRLSNGNTFIATQNQLLEVDKSGKELININRPNFDIAAGTKLRNGGFAILTTTGMFVRLDATGKEIKSFTVGPFQIYCNIEVLANGRLVFPQYGQNRVVEFDTEGKPVWEAQIQWPTSAVRLPNGHTLVSSQNSRKVTELDRSGKQVWEYRDTGNQRPWRAYRR
jgi:HEAT repeat protein